MGDDARRKGATSISMILSMPAGTDPERLREAALDFAREEFANRSWVASLHVDRDHPHVHLTFARRDHDGRRFHPSRDDLFAIGSGLRRSCEIEVLRRTPLLRERGASTRSMSRSRRRKCGRRAGSARGQKPCRTRAELPRPRHSRSGERCPCQSAGDGVDGL
jgi:hypothetical protein